MPHKAPQHNTIPMPVERHVPAGVDTRETACSRGYDGTWQKFRLMFLHRHPVCECGKPAVDVHHIHALADGGRRLDDSNCMALCHECHSRITGKAKVKHG